MEPPKIRRPRPGSSREFFTFAPQAPGTYAIKNTANQRIYIGETADIQLRFCTHLVALRQGAHHNEALQADWKRYGEPAFTFTVLISPDRIEPYYINQYRSDDPAHGYNLPKQQPPAAEHADKVQALAALWGFTGKRYSHKTIARCIELAYQQLIADAE